MEAGILLCSLMVVSQQNTCRIIVCLWQYYYLERSGSFTMSRLISDPTLAVREGRPPLLEMNRHWGDPDPGPGRNLLIFTALTKTTSNNNKATRVFTRSRVMSAVIRDLISFCDATACVDSRGGLTLYSYQIYT